MQSEKPEDNPYDGCLQFLTARNKQILVITRDGRLERGEDFRTDDEASVAFIECLESIIPVLQRQYGLGRSGNFTVKAGLGDLRGNKGGNINFITALADEGKYQTATSEDRT